MIEDFLKVVRCIYTAYAVAYVYLTTVYGVLDDWPLMYANAVKALLSAALVNTIDGELRRKSK